MNEWNVSFADIQRSNVCKVSACSRLGDASAAPKTPYLGHRLIMSQPDPD
jgi:hypothetical protein